MTDRARTEGWFGGPATTDAGEESSLVARRLSAPTTEATGAGLPLRTPAAHLVPGAYGGEKSAGRDTPPPPDRSADDLRRHLDGYRAGVRRGRRTTEGS